MQCGRTRHGYSYGSLVPVPVQHEYTCVTFPEQLARLNELEDLLAEQNNAMGVQTEELKRSRRETDEWKANYETLLRAAQAEKDLCVHITCTVLYMYCSYEYTLSPFITTLYKYEYISFECLGKSN